VRVRVRGRGEKGERGERERRGELALARSETGGTRRGWRMETVEKKVAFYTRRW
jgi:hypothetical protein